VLLAKTAVETSDDIHAYKPFVDGLRAVAILAVVAGHLDLPGMSGGFVGVDVFFVISGYLIINQIAADIRKGRFSLLDFWARRAFRILPAFLLVVSACLVLAAVVLVQYEYRDFANSFFFSTIMQANHYFLLKQNYFENIAYAKPLLHTWSLSVEEQFYIVAPLALVGMAAWTRRRSSAAAARMWIAVTAGLLVASFVLCVALTRDRHNIAFYIMPARGWEFLLGGIVPWCVAIARGWSGRAITALALAGVAAIAVAVAGFGFETTYPSYRAMLPALGAMLIIVGGLADPRNVVARTLATAPFVAIGLVSYSWYLWHWPLLSFLRLFDAGARDLAWELGAVVLGLALAALSWRFVERPCREWRRRAAPRPGMAVAAGIAACIVIGSAGGLWSKYAMPRLTPSLEGLEAAAAPAATYPPVVRRGDFIGDSQADTLSESLVDHARRAGASLKVTMYGGCPPILHVTILYNGKPEPLCGELYRRLALTGSEFVIMSAVWDLYVTPPPPDRDFVPFWLADPQTGRPAADPYAVLAGGLAATIAEAKRAGVKRILVIGAFPRFPTRPPNCVLRVIRLGVDHCSPSRPSVDAHLARTRETLRRVTAGVEGVRLVDPIDVFCTPSVCRPYEDHTVYFKDIIHVTPAGAERFYQAFRDDIRWALTGEESRRE
jgi:peptidoglycan/LPS O-acetylase OafA/YrhL